MSENVDLDFTELRAALADAAKIEDLAERSLEVVAVVEPAGAPLGIHPVGSAGWPSTSGPPMKRSSLRTSMS